jgi:hypothetical protein
MHRMDLRPARALSAALRPAPIRNHKSAKAFSASKSATAYAAHRTARTRIAPISNKPLAKIAARSARQSPTISTLPSRLAEYPMVKCGTSRSFNIIYTLNRNLKAVRPTPRKGHAGFLSVSNFCQSCLRPGVYNNFSWHIIIPSIQEL